MGQTERFNGKYVVTLQHQAVAEEARELPPFVYGCAIINRTNRLQMIDRQRLTRTVEEALEGTDLFLVDVDVTPDNRITVEIDSSEGVDIDTCVELSRKIEAAFDRDAEDYELEVGSAGLTSPLKVKGQFDKNIGHEVEVMMREGGKKLCGVLRSVSDDMSEITITVSRKVRPEGKKKPVMVEETIPVRIADTNRITPVLDFK